MDDYDIFQPKDISGLVQCCTTIHRKDNVPISWAKQLPREYKGKKIFAHLLLLDTKRSMTNYKNTFHGHNLYFCLDHKANWVNDILTQQAISATKVLIRVGEYLCTGSTTIMDQGDYHVVDLSNKVVTLKRLKSQTEIPYGRAFKHTSEEKAEQHLTKLFDPTLYSVKYEPFTLNFADESLKDVHCYNVDFRLRKKTSNANVGIEVKLNMGAWERDKDKSMVKFKKYEEMFGAPCVLFVVDPTPAFFSWETRAYSPRSRTIRSRYSWTRCNVSFIHLLDASLCVQLVR